MSATPHNPADDFAPGLRPGAARDPLDLTEPTVPAPTPALIARELSGRLPCANCGYNLQGVSVLGVCPECGTAVRATILAVVDPLADELQPIRWPWLVATGVVLWIHAGLLAAVLGWRAVLTLMLGMWVDAPPAPVPPQWGWYVAGLLFAAGVGSMALWKPQDGIKPWMSVMAMITTLCYIPLGLRAERLITQTRGMTIRSISDLWGHDSNALLQRVCLVGSIVVLLICARPVARALVARSLAIRLGRVDRQTMLAMVAALLICVAGDVMGYFGVQMRGGMGDALQHVGFIMLIGGFALFTCGLVGAAIDAIRVARAVLSPSPGLSQVLGSGASL